MMGRLNREQAQFFYSFSLEEIVPDDHLVRKIATFVDLAWVRKELAPYYSSTGRPSIDPELIIRMLIIGYVFAIRSERMLCRELAVNMAYRWFCGLTIEDKVPDHSAFSRARHERFRESDLLRRIFERVVATCIGAGLVGGEGFAVDASLIVADANKQRSIPGTEWKNTINLEPPAAPRRSIWPRLMIQRLERRATLPRSLFRHRIRLRNGPVRCADRHFSPMPTIISLMSRWASLLMWKPLARSGKPRWVQQKR